MPLFIDRLPLYHWAPRGGSARLPLWSASVPIIISDPGRAAPPPHARAQRWAIDTRFTGEAYAWRHHLQEAGIDPDALRLGYTSLTPLGATPQPFPLRDADLWLCSNIPALRNAPWRLELDEGVALRDVRHLPNPESNCPLLGMRALRRAGLTVKIDFARATVSIWTPGPWYESLTHGFRRFLTGGRTVPVPW